jgi:hypothetical protein
MDHWKQGLVVPQATSDVITCTWLGSVVVFSTTYMAEKGIFAYKFYHMMGDGYGVPNKQVYFL